jgi:tRNA-dihydrouridine synthase A
MTQESQRAGAPDRHFSVAPMMEWTDRHDRFFLRCISRHALLYTEMVTAPAILHGPRERLLGFSAAEHPVALQLGGSEAVEMAEAAVIGEAFGYDEINMNVGCPSDRVQSGRFGACLMAEPDLVANCVAAMQRAVSIPVTVKSRIGIDDSDSYEDLVRFIEPVAAAGCGTFIVHARKAILAGLSPKQNREIPPLRYDTVYRLKTDYPDLEIVINGGITSLDAAAEHLRHVDGVMMGREAYHNPFVLADVDRRFFNMDGTAVTRHGIAQAMLPYIDAQIAAGTRLNAITRHMMGLFNGLPGARAWRRHLSENSTRTGAGSDVVREALLHVPDGGQLRHSA